jgi:cytochrome c2
MRAVYAGLALSFGVAAAGPALAQDAAAGKAAFVGRCSVCHQTEIAKSGPVAPSLKGVVGRRIASLGDYAYSDALKAKPGRWTPEALDTFLASPMKAAPGTRMMLAVTNPADRANLIAYLKTAR